MDIKLADVTIHIDKNLSSEQRGTTEESLRALDGVVSIHNPDKTPHLILVEYDPDVITSHVIQGRVTDQGTHAELVGL
jgi:hypothetical protein